MRIYDDIIQGSPEWDAIRLGKVTASCFSDATSAGRGKSPSVTRLKYMRRLVAERDSRLPQESYSNTAMEWGVDTEQVARKDYGDMNGISVRQVGFIERDEDVGGSPDGLVGDDGMIEIKCPFTTTHIKYIQEGKVPTEYFKQVQGNLWIAERKWCDFISFDPRMSKRKFFIRRVYRDEKFIKELHIKIVMFVTEMKEMLEELNNCPF
jgi:putative phage-type endonuclease